MDFDLSTHQKALKKKLTRWLDLEFQTPPPGTPMAPRSQPELIRSLLEKAGPLGFYLQTGTDPKHLKDSPAAETLTSVFLSEELAFRSPSVCLAMEMSTRLFGWVIACFGNGKQQEEILSPLRRGSLLGALAMAESSGNFPNKVLGTEAEKVGKAYRLTGRKKQVINAPIADYLAVTGKTDGQCGIFLVKSDQPGLLVESPLKPLGLSEVTIADVTLNGCLIEEDRVIGPFPDPNFFPRIQTRADLIITVVSMGILSRTLQEIKKYVGESRDGGKPAQAYQEIRFKMAEMFTLFQTAQWMLYRAAWMLETQSPEAETVAACAKVFITEAAEEAARTAMQIMAGDGYLTENLIEQCFRDARFGPIAEETSEVLRMRIAEDCLTKFR
jgi:alkylation response protein AidB-like acyl-CoA dehydrogenase